MPGNDRNFLYHLYAFGTRSLLALLQGGQSLILFTSPGKFSKVIIKKMGFAINTKPITTS